VFFSHSVLLEGAADTLPEPTPARAVGRRPISEVPMTYSVHRRTRGIPRLALVLAVLTGGMSAAIQAQTPIPEPVGAA
jgi:hypothetical protein